MLDSVKQKVQYKLNENIDFNIYFIQYVHRMQDANIDAEVTFSLRNNTIDINMIDRIVNLTLDRW